jgi:hypothetical protein
MDSTKGLRNQVKRHQAAAARGNGQSLTEGLPEGHGASLQASKDAQARVAVRRASRPTAADTSWVATRTDSQLKAAYVPPSGKEGKRELQQNNAVAAELRKRGIPLPR